MQSILTNDKQALELFRKAFPETSFRNLTLRPFAGPMSLESYWSDGYRDYFRLLHVASGQTVSVIPQNGTPFDAGSLKLSELPIGYALAVNHYRGNGQGGTLYFNAADLVPLLPPAVELTFAERVVLACTRNYKAAYRINGAERDCGLNGADYAAAKASLTAKGLLNSAGSITNEGRNIIGDIQPHHIKRE